MCPPDAVAAINGSTSSCTWVNGTHGMLLPPGASVMEYCDYISSGYFGYLWDKAAGGFDAFPCPPSASQSSSAQSWFCDINDGAKGVTLPAGAKPNCGTIATTGTFGFTWTTAEE